MPVWTDFISDFMSLTQGALSPDLFRRWTAISLVAAALERRVWVKTGPRIAYPNLYVLLVGPPGVGKYIIEDARDLWRETLEPGTKLRAFKVAPDSVTNASLMDALAKAKAIRLPAKGPPITYHSLIVAAEEIQVLLPSYDLQFIASLNSIFNNKPLHEESRRTGSVKELKIENPQLNILGGAQPAYFTATFPEEAWNTGLARRIIMIYSPELPIKDIFFEPEIAPEAKAELLLKLARLSQLYGQMMWYPEAQEIMRAWHLAGGPPVPNHTKLTSYCQSRTLHSLKLSVVSAVARTGKLVIEPEDVRRAIEWLLDAEKVMPDIFRAMIGRSDAQVLEELHLFLMSSWVRAGQKAISGALIWNFLRERVPSDKIEKIILIGEKSGMIARFGGISDLWVPRPRHEWGVE